MVSMACEWSDCHPTTGERIVSVHDLERTTADAGFSNPVIRWIDYRLPLFTFLRHELDDIRHPEAELSLEFRVACRHHSLGHDRDRIVLALHYVSDRCKRVPMGRAHHA